MTLKLYYHPLSSYCWKALIALYENETPFEAVMVNFTDPTSRAAFEAVWPMAKMPVLVDGARDRIVAEATVVIEYLDTFYPGATRFVPTDPDRAWQSRLWDRFHDNYLQTPMQRIVANAFRPKDEPDAFGVAQAHTDIRRAYQVLERDMKAKTWAIGNDFTLADCAAAPALFYADVVAPFGPAETNLTAYLGRLKARPSFARTLREAEPYFPMFPVERKPRL